MKKYISLFVILSVVFIVGFNSASAKAADISAMEQQLQILMQQLQVLQNQFRQQSGGAIPSAGNETLKIPENSGLNTSIPIVSPSTSTPVIGGGPSNIEYPIQNPGNISWCHAFNTNIGMGATGPEVSALETALNKEGLGNFTESTYDDALASAVSGFQEKYRSDILTPNGLQYGTGYVGPSTRTKLNSLYGCNNSIISPVPVPLPAPIITTTTSNSITISSVSGEYSGVGNLTQGQTAYIKGTGFDASHNYKVEFLDTPVSVNATVNDSNTMTFITPVFGAGSYNYNLRVIDMSVSGSISNSLPVTLLALTTSKSGIIITAVNSVDTNPGIIVQGQTAYILGSGFNQSTNYTVFIGNNDSQQYSITPTVVDSNHMTFIVPSSLPVISSPYVYGLKVGVYNSGLGGYDLSNTLQVTVISASPIATTTQAAPYIHIYGTDGSQTSDSSISANIGDTFTISGVPQNIQGLSYYYGSGYPPSGYYNRAFFFDFGNNNSCGNNTEWTLTCTAKVPGSIAYSVAIYANGQTYMSNKVTVTVNNSSAT
ncbi:MAG: peptidoglycan-binding protein, partial [Patescibacteria group bacterium]|nr:peptidoglycan-binding protein [Patescibacteria group bacterium]